MTVLLPLDSVARLAGPCPTKEKYTDGIQDSLSCTRDARRFPSMDTEQQSHVYQKASMFSKCTEGILLAVHSSLTSQRARILD